MSSYTTFFTKKKKGCRKCEFFKKPMVPSEIREEAKAALIGETPWDFEVRYGRPFMGPSGDKLHEVFAATGFSRDDFSLCNSVRCQPDVDPRTGSVGEIPLSVVKRCTRLFLIPELMKLKPNVIVPMGDVAMHALTNKRGITKQRGFIFHHEFQNGSKKFTAKVIPTFHPAYVIRVPSLMPFSLSDFRQIQEQIDHKEIIDISKKVKYISVTNKRQFIKAKRIIDKSKDAAVDLETTGFKWLKDDILCCSISPRERISYVFIFYKKYPKKKTDLAKNKQLFYKVIKWIFNLLHSGKVIYGQNFPFDLRFLYRLFLLVLSKHLNVDKINWREVLLLQILLDENIPKDLKSSAHMLTDIRYKKSELDIVKAGLIKEATIKQLTSYAGKDADATLRVGHKHVVRLKNEHDGILWKLFSHHEMVIAKYLFKISMFGIHADRRRVVDLREKIRKKLKKLKQEMHLLAGKKFNIRSTKILQEVMFKKLRIRGNKDFLLKSGAYSTGKEHLQWLFENSQHPFIKLLQTYREYDKVDGTTLAGMLEWMDKSNIIHPELMPWGTVTGRIASHNPNVLNIPRDREFKDGDVISIRWCFTARPGYVMIVADYSQIELKMIALMANVSKILNQLKQGEDFHQITARDMYGKRFKKAESIVKKGFWKNHKFNKNKIKLWAHRMDDMRSKSKTFNFALIFGSGDDTLAAQLNTSLKKARGFKERFFELYPEIRQMMSAAGTMALTEGYVQLPNGRFRRFPKVNNRRQQAEQRRQAFNTLPQGTAGYQTRYALVRICKRFEKEGIDGYVINIVYDSIMAETKPKHLEKASYIIAEEMLRPSKMLNGFSFSIKIGAGHDWQECENNGYKIVTMRDFKKWIKQKKSRKDNNHE